MAVQDVALLAQQRKELYNEILNSDFCGRNIYILGSAEFGPTNTPILIRSTTGLYSKFGRQGSLIKAWHAIKYVSRYNHIYCVKTTGEHSSAYFNVNVRGQDPILNGFILTASQSNETFNDTQIVFTTNSLTIHFPTELHMQYVTYSYNDYPTIETLANAINQDTNNKKSFVYAYYTVNGAYSTKEAFCTVNPELTYLHGGECGLNYSKNLLYNCLKRSYDILESHPIDILIPVDAFLDDMYPDELENSKSKYGRAYYQTDKDYLTEDTKGNKLSFLDQAITFCMKQLNFGIVTHGILGFNSYYKEWSRYLSEADDLVFMYKACLEYNIKHCTFPDYAFLVSVVGGDTMYNYGTIIDNGYLAYAAICCAIDVTRGTTNVPIQQGLTLWHEFSEESLQILADSGIAAFRHSPYYNCPVVYNGVTCCTNDENLKLWVNVRMISLCMCYLSKIYQMYIGHSMNYILSSGILKQDINNILLYLKERDIVTEFDFEIVPYYSSQEIKVYLTLMTNYMVKAVQCCSVINVQLLEEHE